MAFLLHFAGTLVTSRNTKPFQLRIKNQIEYMHIKYIEGVCKLELCTLYNNEFPLSYMYLLSELFTLAVIYGSYCNTVPDYISMITCRKLNRVAFHRGPVLLDANYAVNVQRSLQHSQNCHSWKRQAETRRDLLWQKIT